MGVTPRSRRTSSGIPRSTGPSRETSPNRYSGGYGQRRIGTGRSGITPDRPPKRPQMTEKILKQSLEAETAIADALVRLRQYQNDNLKMKISKNVYVNSTLNTDISYRKVHHERIQGRTLMDCLMTVTGQMKVKHQVFALKDLIQILGDDRVMA